WDDSEHAADRISDRLAACFGADNVFGPLQVVAPLVTIRLSDAVFRPSTIARTQSMARVFISHATPDRSFVERAIIPLLEKHGIQTWYARTDIQGASEWERAILNGLRSCDQLLVVMSPRSARSKWVKREVDWAFAKERPVVPVMLEDCDPDDFHFGLAAIQFVDFRGGTQAGRQRLLDVFRGGQSRSEEAE